MASRLAKGTLVLTLLLVLGLAYAYGGRLFGSGNGKPAVSVTGTIEAIQVDVSARIAGRIIERPVNEGDRVVAGQLLVRLDEAELAAEVRRQEAAVRTAQSTLNDLLAGARREEMEDARAALQSASATREWTERDFRRAEGLFRQTLIAAQEVDRARQAYEVAAAQEKSARQKLLLLEAGSRPDQVEAARGQLAQARNALDMARTRLKEMTILSPLDGVVLRKNLEVGELANPGVPILTLMKPSDIWVRAYVPEEEVGADQGGQPGAGRGGRVSGPAVSRPDHRDRGGGRVHAPERPDPEGAGEPGLPDQDRGGQPGGHPQARHARGCRH